MEKERAHKFALITAKTWVGAAKFKDDIKEYRRYRDSIVASENSTIEEIKDYLKSYQSEPEKYIYYGSLLSRYVDSLVGLEDSTLKEMPPTEESMQEVR